MTDFGMPSGELVNASGNVAGDIPCRKCSYNLRSLSVEGLCPECGTPVGRSVRGDFLRYSDPQFVATLRTGIRLILWGIALIIILAFCVIIYGVILSVSIAAARRGAGGGAAPAGPAAVSFLQAIAQVPGYAMVVLGSWLLTSPDPSGLGEDQYGTSRRIIRLSLLVGLFNYFATLAMAAAPAMPQVVRIALGTIGGLSSLFSLVGQIALFIYLGKLALRIPDYALSKRANFLMWAFGISYGILILGGIGALILAPAVIAARTAGANPAGPAIGGMVGFGCLMGIAGLATLVFLLMYLRMLHNFGLRFKEAAEQGRLAWSTKPGAQPA
jgi:hypothetical protein